MQRETGGYFTVEAAMVVPIVLYVIFLLLYLLFFQYNRCLLEQDLGVLVLRGSMAQAETNEERAEILEKEATELDKGKYIGCQCKEIYWKMEKGTLQAEQQGALKLLFEKERWKVKANYENHIVSPVSFLRYYRKLIGGKDDTNGIH